MHHKKSFYILLFFNSMDIVTKKIEFIFTKYTCLKYGSLEKNYIFHWNVLFFFWVSV